MSIADARNENVQNVAKRRRCFIGTGFVNITYETPMVTVSRILTSCPLGLSIRPLDKPMRISSKKVGGFYGLHW